MKFSEQEIKDILLKGSYISADVLEKSSARAKERNMSLQAYLLEKQMITPDLFGQAVAEFFGLNYADVNSNPPAKELVLKIPENLARQYRIILFKETAKEIVVSTDSPQQTGLKENIAKIFPDKRVKLAYSLEEDIDNLFLNYRTPLDTRFAEIIKKQSKVAPEITDEILNDAFSYRASDIHFEPQEKEVVIRFRVDGVLHEAGRMPKQYYSNILNHIKVQAQLRIDEHFSAQDGAIHYSRGGKNVDLRVSVLPTVNGEKIAIRLLSEYVHSFNLEELGLNERNQTLITQTADKPFGMVLLAGPTGSGKTTTLYALIKMVNSPDINITTIEDPVEYKIPGINQIQVNPQTNLTFAHGLRSIVRQDPDTILVGEIRDKETAEIAVNAALTGHLLFSTIHGNDASTGIVRLLDMGIEPFLVASTVQLVASQRLVRKICTSCRYSEKKNRKDLVNVIPNVEKYFPKEEITLYKGKGCKACGNTGYLGRTLIFESMAITPQMQELILKNPSGKQIWDLARSQGAISMFEDGIEKVKGGITTLEELLRVASPPEA